MVSLVKRRWYSAQKAEHWASGRILPDIPALISLFRSRRFLTVVAVNAMVAGGTVQCDHRLPTTAGDQPPRIEQEALVTTYVVTYDLVKEEDSADYAGLKADLIRFNGFKYQFSSWLIDTQISAESVIAALNAHLDNDDRIWVSELTSNRSFNKAFKGINDWLLNHPPDR